MKINLKIVTPEKIVLSTKVSQVSISTTEGQITILPGHVPLVSRLAAGEILVKSAEAEESLMAVSGGLIEVLPAQVVILADSADRAEEIDEAKAEEARQKAQEILKNKVMNREEFALLTAQMERELARLKVARKYKQRGIRTINK